MLPEKDGLEQDWNDYRRIYVNPPYGADRERGTSIKNWLAKCARTHTGSNLFLGRLPQFAFYMTRGFVFWSMEWIVEKELPWLVV